MSGYGHMRLSVKRQHMAKGSPSRPGRVYRPEPRYEPATVECRRCRVTIRAEDTAAHAERCAGIPLK